MQVPIFVHPGSNEVEAQSVEAFLERVNEHCVALPTLWTSCYERALIAQIRHASRFGLAVTV